MADDHRRPSDSHSQGSTRPADEQLDLIDWGRHSAETREEAARAARPRRSERREQIAAYVAACGPSGACRHEIAITMGWPVQSVTSPVLELLRDGRLRESGERRLTPYGRPAAVLVTAEVTA